MRRLLCTIPLMAILMHAPSFANAQETSPPEPSAASREMIEQEKTRAAFEEVLVGIGKRQLDFDQAREKLVALGAPVIPFVQSRLSGRGTAPLYLFMCSVLGDLKTDEAVRALREAIARSDQATGPVKAKKKIWACYGLALAGQADAVDVLNSGELKTGNIELFDRASATEIIGAMTAPASIPRLVEMGKRYASVQEMEPHLVSVLDALGRIAEPTTLPEILPYLKHSSPKVRGAAARTIGRLGETAGVAPLFNLLTDPSSVARDAAAEALSELKPAGKTAEILARLDLETERSVRTFLYTALAAISGESALEPLRGFWDRPDRVIDRWWIAGTVGSIGSAKGLPFLRSALDDPDVSLAITAVNNLATIGGAGATETLLARVSDRRWPVAQTAIQRLVDLKERRAGPRVADRLLAEYLAAPLADAERWPDVYAMGDALASLGHADAIPGLRKAVTVQTDPTLLKYLKGLLERLSAVKENGAEVGKWTGAMASGDQGVRRVAYARLGEIGGDQAAEGLMNAFSAATPDDQVEVLRALADTKSLASAPLIERVLLDGAYDPEDKARLRSMAAYSARRLGGERMIATLRKSAERREGQDVDVLTYLAVAAGKDAIPVLKAVRIPRLRHPSGKRGLEQVRLDWMIRELSAGRSVGSLDRPPERLMLD